MIIEIENLTFKCIIGLLDFERIKKQRVIVDIKIEYNYQDGNYIDYAKVCKIVKKTLKKGKFELLEDALEESKNSIYSNFPNIESLYIKIAKPDILKDCTVSLSNSWHFTNYHKSL